MNIIKRLRALILLLICSILFACGSGGTDTGDVFTPSPGDPSSIVISGNLSDSVSSNFFTVQGFWVISAVDDWIGAQIQIIDFSGNVITSTTADGSGSGSFSVSVPPGTGYFIRASIGNLVLLAYAPPSDTDQTITVDPRSTAIVKALGEIAGVNDLGDEGVDASDSLPADIDAAISSIGNSPLLNDLADVIAQDITDNYDPDETEPAVGGRGGAGDDLAVRIAAAQSDETAPSTTAAPPGGTYAERLVSLTCDDGEGSGCYATYYTTDGSDPTTSSTAYSGAVWINTNTTLKFFSIDNAGNAESIKTESYVIIQTFTIGGTVSGSALTNWLWLDLNGVAQTSVSVLGPFVFTTIHTTGYNYEVTVQTSPPGQTCTVTNGIGTIMGGDVTDILVECSDIPPTYTVGGMVSGLAGGETVVLQNNGGDNETITSNGAFAFATEIADGANYSVTVLTQPAGQNCVVTDGSGTISGADVTDVSVTCADIQTYTVGGNVSGLTGTLVLRNNGGDDLTIEFSDANPFTFATAIADGSAYTVIVLTQPVGQNCVVTNGSGTISGGDVTDVSVTCADIPRYTVSGLAGEETVELQNNSANTMSISADGPFTFSMSIADGEFYSVTVLTQPAGQNCAVTNGFGMIPGGNVTNVVVACSSSSKSWIHPADLADNISPNGGEADRPHVAMDNNGNAIITWEQNDDTTDCGGAGARPCLQIFMSEYRSGSWIHPADFSDNISPDGAHAYDSPIAMDDNGNAIIAWQQANDFDDIYKSEYRSGSWIHPEDLADNMTQFGSVSANWLRVAMDNNGNAIIVWERYDDSTDCGGSECSQIFMSEYRSGIWTHPASLTDNISPDGGNANGAQVSMDDNGNAIIVWSQKDGTTDCGGVACDQIYMSEYRSGIWTHPEDLADNISPDWGYAGNPTVAMDNSGSAIIVWSQRDGTTDCGIWGCIQIFMSEYRSGSWTHPEDITDSISPDGESATWNTQVAMDNNGNAIIVWTQDDGNTDRIFMSEYRSGAWTHPAITDSIFQDGYYDVSWPQVAMDNNGDAIIVWAQETDIGSYQLFISEHRSGNWTHPANMNDNISPNWGDASYPKLSMGDNGDAIIVWTQRDDTTDCGGDECTQVYMSEYRSLSSTYSVGGNVSGLIGSGLVLQNNGDGDETITSDGSFTFTTAIADGADYSVTVLTQPTGQTCSITNGSGTISGADVTDVDVTCAANTYSVGGVVNGLAGGETVVLQNNGGGGETITSDGSFTFTTAIADGADYSVTVLTQPTGQTCSITNGSGTISGADVINVTVTCATTGPYSVGGTVTGLAETLELRNNGGDDLTILDNGPFTFDTLLNDGSSYNVTISSSPGIFCTVTDGSGTISGADVTNIQVTCDPV